jgi:hypothetical protein
MNCLEFEQHLPLLLYSELPEAERAACQTHLGACAACRTSLQRTEALHKVMAARPRREPAAAFLAESRLHLETAIDHEQHGWRALLHNWPPILCLQPASGFALGLTLMICGFGLGWGLRPQAARLTAGPLDANSAAVTSSDLGNMRINGISRIAPDPKTGGVYITMDAERRVSLEGSLDNPEIQQVLVYAMKSYDNPGIRRDTLDALRAHINNPNIRQALLYALRHDSNPGVRLEALDAVRNMEFSEDVHHALLDALQHDTNLGVRVAAVDALIDSTEKEGCDAPTAHALEHLATTDRNPYVRLKCANAMMKLEK